MDSVQVPQWVCSHDVLKTNVNSQSSNRVPPAKFLAMLPVLDPLFWTGKKRVKASDPETEINIYSTFLA